MWLLVAGRQDRIEGVAKSIGVSGRHLHRSFMASVGCGPKLFQRILRFQRLLTLAKADSSAPLGHVALSAGYADQAHMTRDVGEFAGVTPSALLGKVVSALALSELLSGGG
jgi:transcriptional regulator GlxA family with amidase domain